jgi:hypothetical protein
MDNFSRKTHIKTSRGWLSKTDINDWLDIYNEYLDSKSLLVLSKEFGISNRTLKNIFLSFNFKLLSEKEINERKQSKKKQTCLKKYGVENPSQSKEIRNKSKQTCLKKYGVEYSLQSEKIRDKSKQTNLKRYGFENPFQSKDIKNKIKKTNLKKYGFENPFQSEEVKDKIKRFNLKRYKFKNPMMSNEIKNKSKLTMWLNIEIKIKKFLKENNYKLLGKFEGIHNTDNDNNSISWHKYNIKHLECGNIYKTYFNGNYFVKCPKCYPYQSNKEIFFRNFISNELDINTINNKRNIVGKELDIFIEDLRIGFEYNGSFWHSIIHDNKDKNYHKNKTELCLEKDIKLYHIWEHDNEEIIKSLIRSKLNKIDIKYFARKLIIKQVDYKTKKDFFDNNHLHGDVNSSFCFGLYDGLGNLIQCISFRKHKEGLEIARFASLINTQIVGGFSKLLKHSIKYIKENYANINKIITYCDRDWTPSHEDSVYYKNGFSFIGDSGCQLKYYNLALKTIESREKYQKHKLKVLFPDIYNDNLIADQILYKKRIYPICNSGNWKYILDI